MTSSRFLGDLFEAEAPKLRRLLRRFGPDVSPEDIVQESFARFCSADPATIESPRAYLFQTARNIALNDIRRSRSAPITAAADHDLLNARASAPNPEEELQSGEELAQLDAAVSALPTHLRQALLAYKIEGRPHREIARSLGVTERTVRRYISEALAQCHVALCANAKHDG